MRRRMDGAEGSEAAAAAWAGAADIRAEVIHNSGPTARKSCSRFQRKLAVGSSRFPKSSPSNRPIRGWRKNCATSTVWAIRLTKQTRDFAKLASLLSRKGSSFRRETDTTRNGRAEI